jgi:hypothetical protein
MNLQIMRVNTFKVVVPIDPAAIPRDLVPPEPLPAGSPVLDLVLEGGTAVTVRAQLSGKSTRKALKQIAGSDPGTIACAIQGSLKPPSAPGEPFLLEAAGLQVFVKAPRPEAAQ